MFRHYIPLVPVTSASNAWSNFMSDSEENFTPQFKQTRNRLRNKKVICSRLTSVKMYLVSKTNEIEEANIENNNACTAHLVLNINWNYNNEAAVTCSSFIISHGLGQQMTQCCKWLAHIPRKEGQERKAPLLREHSFHAYISFSDKYFLAKVAFNSIF